MKVSRVATGLFAAVVVVTLLLGCAGSPEPATQSGEPEQTSSANDDPPGQVETEPDQTEEQTPIEEPVEDPEPAPDEEPEEFTQEDVTEELYDQTFTEVEETIAELNEIISNGDFSRWQTYLTDDYRRTYSDSRVLEESSQSAILRRNNITLRTLEDYFRFVVVPSRANVRLDEIVFVDAVTVEAIMEVEGEKYLLYNLTKAGDRWKIDTF